MAKMDHNRHNHGREDNNRGDQEQGGRPAVKSSKKSASAFRTISEVAKELDVQQHVLRFWESRFSQVRPLKRGGGRRYYRPEDLELLKVIHHLLYTEGYTIKGVQKLLREQGKNQVVQKYYGTVCVSQGVASQGGESRVETPPAIVRDQSGETAHAAPQEDPVLTTGQVQALRSVLQELQALKALVQA